MNMYVDDLKAQNMTLHETIDTMPEKKGGNLQQEIRNLEEALRIKQNTLNSMKSLMAEKDRKIGDMEYKLASISSQIANLESYRETFPYILNELLNCVRGKTNKLKHSIKTLTTEDESRVREVFKKHAVEL